MKLLKSASVLLVFALVFSLLTPALAAEIENREVEEIKAVAEEYITNLSRNRFLYEENNTEALTIKPALKSPITRSSLSDAQAVSFEDEVITVGEMKANIDYVEDVVDYERYSRQSFDITREDFSAQYVCSDIRHVDDTATVRVSENITFMYTDDPLNTEPSYISSIYTVKLMNLAGQWYVADVTDEFAFSEASKESGFDLSSAVNQFDAMMAKVALEPNEVALPAEEEYDECMAGDDYTNENHVMTEEEIEAWLTELDTLADPSSTDAIIDQPNALAAVNANYVRPQAAVGRQYAYTYWWDDLDAGYGKWVGVNKDKWRNVAVFSDYGSNGGNCSNFASQLVWAGLGGSNTKTAVTGAERPLSSTWTKGQSAFIGCNAFVSYTDSVRKSTTMSGLMTNHYDMVKSSSLTQISGYSSILPGSVLHVYNGGTGNQKGHAIYCLKVTGSQWANLYYAANSESIYNLKITDGSFWSRTTEIGVEQPVAYCSTTTGCPEHIYTASNDFTCNRCDFVRVAAFQRNPTNHMGITSGVTRTVGGIVSQLATTSTGSMSNFSCNQLAMCVTSPSGKATWYSKNNSYYLDQSVLFNEEGIWTIQFDARDRTSTGTDSNKISYTFTIRVVNYSSLAKSNEYGGVS